MIKVTIEVIIEGVTFQFEKESLGHVLGGNSAAQVDKAQSMLLEQYHKAKKAIESQQ